MLNIVCLCLLTLLHLPQKGKRVKYLTESHFCLNINVQIVDDISHFSSDIHQIITVLYLNNTISLSNCKKNLYRYTYIYTYTCIKIRTSTSNTNTSTSTKYSLPVV